MLNVESKKIKIIVCGDFISTIHEEAFLKTFLSLGHLAIPFSWNKYFSGNILNRIQGKLRFGPMVYKMNRDLEKKCLEFNPDLVFIYRGVSIYPSTLKKIKKSNKALIFGYNNDDPFGKEYPRYFWRLFMKCVPFYDHIFSYRQKNIEDYIGMGYRRTSLLMPYYIKNRNFIIKDLPNNKYICDVAFVGHYEDDGRDEYIKKIIDSEINFKLFGPEWNRSKYYDLFVKKLGPIYPLMDDYNLALNSAKIALVFPSTLNNDTYTRRCFEIPAVGTFMLSRWSSDLEFLFKKGVEADYFMNPEQMIDKILFYLKNDNDRIKIALNGKEKVVSAGHEISNRAQEVIEIYNRVASESA